MVVACRRFRGRRFCWGGVVFLLVVVRVAFGCILIDVFNLDVYVSIGMFDSGVGGLIVVCAVFDQFLYEVLHYVGDIVNGLYGLKPIVEVCVHALVFMDELVELGVKVFVIVCNSVSAVCLCDVCECYDVLVVEVILFVVWWVVVAICNGCVGVIGMVVIVISGVYEDVFAVVCDVEVVSAVCL